MQTSRNQKSPLKPMQNTEKSSDSKTAQHEINHDGSLNSFGGSLYQSDSQSLSHINSQRLQEAHLHLYEYNKSSRLANAAI